MEKNAELQYKFDDFTDLQTKLVLLPRIEEEAVGAVIATLESRDDLAGYILTAVVGEEEQSVDLLETDFCSILSAIREAPSPIVLSFAKELLLLCLHAEGLKEIFEVFYCVVETSEKNN